MGQSAAAQRVLVTGALGVVGVWVLRELLGRDVEVLGTDRSPDFGLAPEIAEQVAFAELDVTDRQGITGVLAEFRPDVVIHLAALMTGQMEADPYRGFEVNAGATALLLEESRAAGVARFVFASSKGVYGSPRGRHEHPTYEPLTEEDPCFPAQLYDHTKLFCEGLGRTYRDTGGPEFVALRFATIYGPGKLARHGPMALASRLIEDSLAGRSVTLDQGGEQKDEFIYVRDVASALVTAALHDSPTRFPLYNIGTGRLYSTEELAETVRSNVPWSDINIGPGLDPMGLGISYYFLFDGSRARSDLGFQARYDLDSGIRDYVRAMETLGVTGAVEPALG